MKNIIVLVIAAFCLWGAEVHAKPNIVFIMADDLGNNDLGYRGGKMKTPHIDALATGGARLESFYGMHVCTPSRASLMTGRYPIRYGLQTFVIFPSHTYGLPTDERTLPQALKDVGYRTLMVGKWHLGHADRKYWPQNRGFDYFYGNVLGEVNYYTRERGGIIDWQRNGEFIKEDGYYTTLIGDEAVKLIEETDKNQPFFLYFASLAPHAPYEAPPELMSRHADIADPQERTYAAMISGLDDQVGRIVAALEKKGVRENTLIVFASDNGGATSGLFASGAKSPEERKAEEGGVSQQAKTPADNSPLRGGKGSLFEGGVRVPAFMNWPGKIQPRVVSDPLHMVDVMPTVLALAGGEGSASHPFDGRDIWETISQGKPSPHEDVLINVEAFRGSIRQGRWKYTKIGGLPGKTQLFDLEKEPSEKTNVINEYPEVAKQLEAKLMEYAREQKKSEWIKAQPAFVGAQGRTVFDPEFDIDDGGLPHERIALPQ